MDSAGQEGGSKAANGFSAMSDEEVVAEIARLIRKCISDVDDTTSIGIDSNLVEDLGIDSLGAYELIMEAEDYFGVEINDYQVEGIKTVQDLVAVVRAADV